MTAPEIAAHQRTDRPLKTRTHPEQPLLIFYFETLVTPNGPHMMASADESYPAWQTANVNTKDLLNLQQRLIRLGRLEAPADR
jgi:hypothetical protein